MAKTNYSFEKRQKEIAKKKKQEEKRQRKVAAKEEETPQADISQQAELLQPPVDETAA